jgi:hypothetical protein
VLAGGQPAGAQGAGLRASTREVAGVGPWRARSVLLACWLLAVSNLVPFVDLNDVALPGGLKVSDALMAVLAAAALAVWAARGFPRAEVSRLLAAAFLLLSVWWVFTLARTVFFEDVPALYAVLLGRDLVYAAVTAVCFVVLAREFRIAEQLLIVLCLAAAVYAVAYTAMAVLHVDGAWIVHSTQALRRMGGLERGWSPASQFVVAMVPVAAWWALSWPLRRAVPAMVVTALLLVEVLVQLTRANYAAVVLGMAASLLLLVVVRGYAGLRRASGLRIAVAVGLMAAVSLGGLLAAGLVRLQSSGQLSYVVARLTSLTGVFSGGRSTPLTWAERLDFSAAIREVIGPDWLWGVGFLHPSIRYYPELWQGTIRNVHVGVLDAIAPFGVIGLACVLLPGAVVLVPAFMTRSVAPLGRRRQALLLAVAAFILGAWVSSVIQTNLWTLPVSGVMLAAGALCFEPADELAGPASPEDGA